MKALLWSGVGLITASLGLLVWVNLTDRRDGVFLLAIMAGTHLPAVGVLMGLIATGVPEGDKP